MLTYNRFIGKLDDKNVKHFTSQLDYKIEDLVQRVQKLYEILYKREQDGNYGLHTLQDFFMEYFDQSREPRPYFKLNINTSDCLSEFNEVCKSLEFMADYLLLSLSNRRWNDTASHAILTNNNATYVRRKEVLVDSDIMNNKETMADEIAKKNSKVVSARVEITKEDLETYPDIKGLQESIDALQEIVTKSENATKELNKLLGIDILDNKENTELSEVNKLDIKNEATLNLLYMHDEIVQELQKQIKDVGMILKYKKIIRELKSEQRFVKIQLTRPIVFKSISKGETNYDFDHDTGYYNSQDEYTEVTKNTIDLNNPTHIYHLLEYYIDLREQHYDDVHSDMRRILDTLDNAVSMAEKKLHKHEKIILEMKINKYTNAQIIQYLHETLGYVCSEANISKLWTTKIPKLIAEEYKQSVEDWLFTYRLKGKYKRCSKCGQNKLATQKYFSPKKDSKDGLHSYCKECRKS